MNVLAIYETIHIETSSTSDSPKPASYRRIRKCLFHSHSHSHSCATRCVPRPELSDRRRSESVTHYYDSLDAQPRPSRTVSAVAAYQTDLEYERGKKKRIQGPRCSDQVNVRLPIRRCEPFRPDAESPDDAHHGAMQPIAPSRWDKKTKCSPCTVLHPKNNGMSR